MSKGKTDANKKSEVLQGTLDLMILKTLQAMGPLHGFGIARRLEQLSEEVLHLNEGTVYTSLLRLQQEGWIAAEWGASENNRKAKFYSITKSGLKQLAKETEDWERISGVIGRVLRLEGQRVMIVRRLREAVGADARHGSQRASRSGVPGGDGGTRQVAGRAVPAAGHDTGSRRYRRRGGSSAILRCTAGGPEGHADDPCHRGRCEAT